MRDHRDTLDAVRRLAPFDGDRLAASWSDSDAKSALFQEITVRTSAAETAPSRATSTRAPRRRGVLAAAGIVVVALALAVVPALVSDNSTPAFAIRELPNGVLEVEMYSRMRDGHALTSELREYGIESDVELIAASPSIVGQVEVFNETGGEYVPEGMVVPLDGSDVWIMTIDPAAFRERLTIRIAVEPDEGQPYGTAAEVFAPGEVLGGLHCALGEPVRAADVATYVTDLGLTPIWEVVMPAGSSTQSTEVEDLPEGEILSGHAVDATTVRFRVREDGADLADGWEPQLSDRECTPEQAAAWK